MTEPQVDARVKIEEWLVMRKSHGQRNIVRVALQIIDAKSWCDCGDAMHCVSRESHEAALWKAISGEGE